MELGEKNFLWLLKFGVEDVHSQFSMVLTFQYFQMHRVKILSYITLSVILQTSDMNRSQSTRQRRDTSALFFSNSPSSVLKYPSTDLLSGLNDSAIFRRKDDQYSNDRQRDAAPFQSSKLRNKHDMSIRSAAPSRWHGYDLHRSKMNGEMIAKK